MGRLSSVFLVCLCELILLVPSVHSQTQCEPSVSASGALDAKWLRFYLGNGFTDQDVVTNLNLQGAARLGAQMWNPNWCRGNPGGFAYAYEGWGPRGFDSTNSRYTVAIVNLQGGGYNCARFDPIVSKIYMWEFTFNEPNRRCPLSKIIWDVDNGKDPSDTGSYMDYAELIAHEVGHNLGMGERHGRPECSMGPLDRDKKNGEKIWFKEGGPTSVECQGLDKLANSFDEVIDECTADPKCHIDPPGVSINTPDLNEGKGPGINIPDVVFVDLSDPNVTTGPGTMAICFKVLTVTICKEI